MIGEHIEFFGGKRVVEWQADEETLDASKETFKVSIGYDEEQDGVTWPGRFAAMLDSIDASKIDAFVVGPWGNVSAGESSEPIVEALVSAKNQLKNLRSLFFGDIVQEESEISWIQNTDFGPLLGAYPKLEHLTVRGGSGLSFGRIRHSGLRELVIQAGGLPAAVVHEVSGADLPELEHLELWLGEPNYGGDATVEDLSQILRGDLFPKLRRLGLRNSVLTDDIAGVLAISPVLKRLEILDLSLGTLGDAGARALCESPAIRSLKLLDLHHHFLSPGAVTRLEAIGIPINVSDRQDEATWGGESRRFISVAE